MNKKLLLLFKSIHPKKKINININSFFKQIKDWDSLMHVNFLLTIEKEFHVKFSMNDFSELDSFNKISKKINKLLNNK
jgi:acyl carrier protein